MMTFGPNPQRPHPLARVTAGAALAIFLSGCAYNVESELYPTEGPCDTTNVSFANDVLPMVEYRCQSCHGSMNPAAGLSLVTYEEISLIGLNGMLSDRINRAEMDEWVMPPDGPLPNCKRSILDAWVADGCPQN